MNTVTSPKGPLPARVYWIRRGLVLIVALSLVFGIGKGLSALGGSDGGGSTATTAAQQTRTSQTPDARPGQSPPAGPTEAPQPSRSKKSPDHVRLPASDPTGVCDAGTVSVTPDLGSVDGGSTVALPMLLITSGEACTWGVSAKSLVVKITSGSDRFWSSQDCPRAVPDQSVVVRPTGERTTKVAVTWNGRRSDAGCAKGTAWADPGYYHVVAASLGGSATDVQFRVDKPPRPTVTKTAHPKKKKHHKPAATQTPKG